jgi:radical SAM superfamily enzyme YgiQ (UPF0313 family)
MPHVALVPFTGLRVREQELLALGMTLPGLRDRAAAIGQLPALGLLTLAGLLPESWTASYLPAEQADDELLDRLMAQRPALVAISALTASAEEAYALGDQLRARRVTCVLGGLHATTCSEDAAPHFDAVVLGDGEPVWHELLADAERGGLRPVYRASRPANLTQAAMPRYDLLGPNIPRFTLQTQRGCPLACDFCAASRLLGPFREKPAELIGRELEAIRRIDPRPLIELADDNTFAGSRDTDELLDVLRRSGARWFTEVDWRLGERPAVVARLAASGCAQVLVGLESLVFRYPGMGAKRDELRRMMDAARAIQEAGVAVNGCFIVGADGETRDSLDRLAEFLLECPLADVQVTLQTPFPGTGLRRRLEREGRLTHAGDWSRYTLFDVTYQPDRMSVAELEAGFRRLLATVFSADENTRRAGIRRTIARNRHGQRA